MGDSGVFTKGTKQNLKHRSYDPKATAKEDHVLSKTGVKGQPFQSATKRVLNRQIACSEQGKAKKEDITRPLNKTTWTEGTKREEQRQIKSQHHKPSSKVFMESSTVDEHDHAQIHAGRRE